MYNAEKNNLEVVVKTRIALYCYYLSISLLTVCAIGIVVKLLFWPPCTQTGNTCVIEPWSVAGLAGTVLAVAATVLAILGAVAVAAWWLSLNNIVTGRVKKLYKLHKKEIGKELEDFITEQQQLVRDQVGAVQTKLQTVESRIETTRTDIDELEGLTKAFIDMAEDGIVTDLIHTPDTWAQKIATLRKFPNILVKMAMVYISNVERDLPDAETCVLTVKDRLSDYFESLRQFGETGNSELNLRNLKISFRNLSHKHTSPSIVLYAWEKALYWRDLIDQAIIIPPEGLSMINSKSSAYQFRIDQLKIGYEQTKEQARRFYQQVDAAIEASVAEMNAQLQAEDAELDSHLQALDAEKDTSDVPS